MPSARLSSGRSPKRCHQGSSEGCLEAHVASKIGIARRRMHDNVCKAVVEHALWRDPDAGAGEVVVSVWVPVVENDALNVAVPELNVPLPSDVELS